MSQQLGAVHRQNNTASDKINQQARLQNDSLNRQQQSGGNMGSSNDMRIETGERDGGQRRTTQKRLIVSKDDDGYIEENEDDGEDDEEEDETLAVTRGDHNRGGTNELSTGGQQTPLGQESTEKVKAFQSQTLKQLAMPLPLVAAGHSLLPDMQFGWKPMADKDIPPIPLCFGLVHYNLEQFNYPKVLYVGPRFKNSYKMHEQYANKLMKLPIQGQDGENMSIYAYPFTFPKFYDSNNITYEEAFDQFVESLENDSSILDQDLNFQIPNPNPPPRRESQPTSALLEAVQKKDEREDFVFDSNFESGNLDFVGKVSDNEYDLLMRLDSNSRSHQQWFYFSVDCKEIKRRNTKGETVKFNIINFTKPNTLYSQGMRPVAWSKQKCTKEGLGWHRVGNNIIYKLSKLCRQNHHQATGYQRTWYQMSFEYTFEYEQDKIWFAYAIPYSFTMLTNFIKAIEEIQKKPENAKNNLIFKKEILGKSLSGVEIPILTITDFSETNKRKKTIIMVGRLHPGETHSSWLIHGFIRYLLSENYKARELRKRIVFKIVPMLNPDGVIVGNYRCSLAGCDMNRNFGGDTHVAQRLNPEPIHFKKMAKSQNRIAFFFDVHSHSSKKSVFIYGPYFPLHSEHYLKIRVMPRLLSEKTQMFRYYSCRFRNEAHKLHSSRLTVFRECNLPQCYTIETSIMGFLSKERQNISFGIPSLQYFGEKLGETLLDWFQILEVHQREKIKKAIIMSKQRRTRKRTIIDIIGEEDYLEYRDVIDDQLIMHEQEEQQMGGGGSPDPHKKHGVGKQKKSQTKRKQGFKASSQSLKKKNNNAQGPTQDNDQSYMNDSNVKQRPLTSHPVSHSLDPQKTIMQEEGTDYALARKLDGIQVQLISGLDQMANVTPHKRGHPRRGMAVSTDEIDDEDEEYFGANGTNVGPESLKPKLSQYQKQHNGKDNENAQDQMPNRGFFVPKLAGFEYLEGPEILQQAAKQLKVQQLSRSTNNLNSFGGRNANQDLMLSNQGTFHVHDDDEQFIYEDQANSQEGDQQPLRRLEDIVGEIRNDLIKANKQSSTAALNANQAINAASDPENQQILDERDLDSQRSDDEDQKDGRKERDLLDEEYDEQFQKMQDCLVSYLDNVDEMLNNKSSSRKLRQSLVKKNPQPQQPQQQMSVIIKEKQPTKPPEPLQSVLQKVSPSKVQRQSLQVAQVKPETLIPLKKEIVFSIKKPATIMKFPLDRPVAQGPLHSQQARQNHHYYQPPQQTFMHYKGGIGNTNSPSITQQQTIIMDPKDLSFPLMNKTNQEFFDLLQKYVHNKQGGVAGPVTGNSPSFQRANSALMPNRQQMLTMSQKQNHQSTGGHQNLSLLHQLQRQQILFQLQSQQHHTQEGSSSPPPQSQTLQHSKQQKNGITSSRNGADAGQSRHLQASKLILNVIPPPTGEITEMGLSQTSNGGGTSIDPIVKIDSTSTQPVKKQRTKSGIPQTNKKNYGTNSVSESPQKRKLLDSKGNLVTAIPPMTVIPVKGKKTTSTSNHQYSNVGGGSGNFILMVDGRGVQGKVPSAVELSKQFASQTSANLKSSLAHQVPFQSAAQVYENNQASQFKMKKGKASAFDSHSKSFVGNIFEKKVFSAGTLNTTNARAGAGIAKMVGIQGQEPGSVLLHLKGPTIFHLQEQKASEPSDLLDHHSPSPPKPKHFIHSRHSSQSQHYDQHFMLPINAERGSSPRVNLNSSKISEQRKYQTNKEDPVVKRGISLPIQGIQTAIEEQKQISNQSHRKGVNFYVQAAEKQNAQDDEMDFETEAVIYGQHVNKLLKEESSTTGLQLQPTNQIEDQYSNRDNTSPIQHRSYRKYFHNGSFIKHSRAVYRQGDSLENKLNLSSTSNHSNQSREAVRVNFSNKALIEQLSQRSSGAKHAAHGGQSPMKNQILIDMFRQANSHTTQAKRSMANLNPKLSLSNLHENSMKKKKSTQMLSGRLAISDIVSSTVGSDKGLQNSLVDITLSNPQVMLINKATAQEEFKAAALKMQSSQPYKNYKS